MFIIEEWKPAISSRFPKFVVYLEVSNLGKVRSKISSKEFKPQIKDDYYSIKIVGIHIFIHDLVAETYIKPKPEGMFIDHINGNKKDNILSNLQYISNIVNAKKGNRSDNETQKNIS